MTLPEWCQTHSLKDFLELIEDKPKERTMNEEITNPAAEAFVAVPVAKLADDEVAAILASKPESASVAIVDQDETDDKEVTVH